MTKIPSQFFDNYVFGLIQGENDQKPVDFIRENLDFNIPHLYPKFYDMSITEDYVRKTFISFDYEVINTTKITISFNYFNQ